jgi:uncharacterized protein
MTYAFRLIPCVATAFLFLLAPTLSHADAPVRKITVVGTAIIKSVPDEMKWTVEISVNDATLAKAKDRHDASLNAALNDIKGLGNAVKDQQTGGIRISRNLFAPDSNEAPQRPFNCSTQITFTLTDFDKYGPIADALSRHDGIEIQSVDYASSKSEAISEDALKNALLNAHDKAVALATTANCTIGGPLEILEGTPEFAPRPMMMMSRGPGFGGTPPPVPGQLEFGGKVTVTYELANKL